MKHCPSGLQETMPPCPPCSASSKRRMSLKGKVSLFPVFVAGCSSSSTLNLLLAAALLPLADSATQDESCLAAVCSVGTSISCSTSPVLLLMSGSTGSERSEARGLEMILLGILKALASPPPPPLVERSIEYEGAAKFVYRDKVGPSLTDPMLPEVRPREKNREAGEIRIFDGSFLFPQ